MSKIYLSRSMTRTMSADHPVGDPTGGAAYSEKNDPVTAIISIASMSASYGAMMAGSIMAGITFTGAALSLVGTVTGNKTLTKIGMVAGIAGGLGQMGAFGQTAKNATWGSTFGGSTAAPVSGTTAPLKNTPTASGDGSAARAMSSSSATTSANAPVQVSGGGNAVADVVDDTAAGFQKINNPAAAGQTGSDWQYFKDASGNSAAIDPAGKYFLNGEQVTGAAGGKFGVGDYANMAWQGTKDIGAGVMDFTKTNPYGAMAIGQVAQPIADYLSGKTDAEIEALDAQTGYATAREQEIKEAIAREKQRRANLSAGYAQVDTSINVNPAAFNQAQAGGLIAGAMQPAA